MSQEKTDSRQQTVRMFSTVYCLLGSKGSTLLGKITQAKACGYSLLPTPYPLLPNKGGFTLLEIIIVLAITGLLAGGLVTVGHQVIKKEREDKTTEHMKRLKVAVMGDPLDARHGIRTSFGYFGDMGSLPQMLEDLYINPYENPLSPLYGTSPLPNPPYYDLSQSLNTGAGWNGPYINPETMEYLNDLKKDYFRQDLLYSSTTYLDSTVEVDVKGRIASSGRDKQAGTIPTPGDDLSVVFFNNELYSQVSGFIRDPAGNGISGVTVAINYASNGTLITSPSVNTGDGVTVKGDGTVWPLGYFNSSESVGNPPNIPYGNHSLSITPKPFMASGAGQTTVDGTTVSFMLINNGASTVTLTNLTAVYNINYKVPPIYTYYETIKVGGTTAKANAGATSGTLVPFTSSQNLLGANSLSPAESPQAVAVCVQSPVTNVPDVSLDSLCRGYATEISLEDFYCDYNSSGTKNTGEEINMTGVVFTITLSNGTVVTFTP